jgi:hypothetical protein
MLNKLCILLVGWGMSGALLAAVNTMTIANLPSSGLEDQPLCFNSLTGKMGKCSNYSEIPVDCSSGEKLQDAINALQPSGRRVLVITGECAEDIYLHRDNTVFRSADPLNRANIKTQTKQINIFRSKDVSFEDITISNGFGGIAMFDQSLVDLNGVEITGNTVMGGVDVYNQSTAVIGSNNVLGPNGSAYAIGARNGSQVVVWSDNNAFNSSNTAWATIYLSGAGMGMWGNNIAVDGPFYLDNNAVLRGKAGINYTGIRQSGITSNSIAWLDTVTHMGDIQLEYGGVLYAYNGSVLGSVTGNLNSSVFVDAFSSIQGAAISRGSHMRFWGTANGNMQINPSASIEVAGSGDLNSNTLYLCGIANDASSVDPIAAATGTVSTTCPPPAPSPAKSATFQLPMRLPGYPGRMYGNEWKNLP